MTTACRHPWNPQTFENRYKTEIFWEHNSLTVCANWQSGVPENTKTSWLTSLMHITFSVKQPCLSRRTTKLCLCLWLTRLFRLLHQNIDVSQRCCDQKSCMILRAGISAYFCHGRLVCFDSQLWSRMSYTQVCGVCVLDTLLLWCVITLPTSGLACMLQCSRLLVLTAGHEGQTFQYFVALI